MKSVENGLDQFMNQNNEHVGNIVDYIDQMKNHEATKDLHQPLGDLQKELEEFMA